MPLPKPSTSLERIERLANLLNYKIAAALPSLSTHNLFKIYQKTHVGITFHYLMMYPTPTVTIVISDAWTYHDYMEWIGYRVTIRAGNNIVRTYYPEKEERPLYSCVRESLSHV